MANKSEISQADRLTMASIRLTRTLRAMGSSGARTGPQSSAFAVIAFAGRIAARDLAELEEVTPATISRIVSKLEERGYVKRERDAADARVQWIMPTPKGAKQYVEGHERRLLPLVKAIAALPREKRQGVEQAIEIIEELAKSVQDHA